MKSEILKGHCFYNHLMANAQIGMSLSFKEDMVEYTINGRNIWLM